MTFNNGLENVIAAETMLSAVDGNAGTLVLRGWRLADIAGQRSLEWLIGTLWQGFVDRDLTEAAVRRDLGAARQSAFDLLTPLLPHAGSLTPIEALRLLLSAIPTTHPTARLTCRSG
jgi:citrate synthase